MRVTTFVVSIAALLIANLSTVDAGRKAGVTMRDNVTVGDKQLTLNGMGLREATMLKVDVYVAGLYVEHRSSDPAKLLAADESKMLVMRFVRDVGRKDIVKAWNEGFKNNATVNVATLKPMIDQLNSWMGDFSDGQTLVFTYVPGVGVSVDIDNVRKGVIKGEDFARSLFAIWLGPKPPNGALKDGLLGK
jgi:hypothetical protein